VSIQTRCPQCQKAYKLPDDKRGKKVRCQDCSHVFVVGAPAAGAPDAPAPESVRPAAPKAPAKPRPDAPGRPAAKAALKKTAPAARPQPAADADPAVDRPAAAGSRRTLLLIGGVAAGALLLLFGGVAVVAVVWWRLGQPKDKPVVPGPVVSTSPSDPDHGAPPNGGDPTKPSDKGQPPSFNPAADWDAFNKVDRGMTVQEVVALLGQPAVLKNVDPPNPAGVDVLYIYNPEPNLKFTVELFQGKVVKKTNSGGRPNHFPSGDVAQNPPAGALTQENFDKIDKGMTMEAVTALLGPETDIGRKPPEHDYVSGGAKIVVVVMRGQVTGKSNNQGWPVVYPSDVAAQPPPGPDKNPPPDKPPPPAKVPITQDLFNQIDKGMTMDQLTALAGKPTSVDDLRFATNPNVDTRVSWENFVADIGIRVDMAQGKVTSKSGYSHGKLWPVVYPSGGGDAPTKPAGSLSKASFDKIDKGMSADDVIALIGQPAATVKLDPAKFGGVDTEMTFVTIVGTGGVAATVDLLKGKVVKKDNPQSWPIVYPSDKGK
jgi:predicted Zn finger-like uncharacterized protein